MPAIKPPTFNVHKKGQKGKWISTSILDNNLVRFDNLNNMVLIITVLSDHLVVLYLNDKFFHVALALAVIDLS